jgi:hypothetical protein
VIDSGIVHVTGSDEDARSLALGNGELSIEDHTLTVSSSGSSTLDGFLAVAGTLTLGDPTTYAGSQNSGGINVGGTLNISNTFEMTGADGGPANAQINDTSIGQTSLVHVLGTGSIVRDTSSGPQTIGPRVDNDGTVSVQTGTLRLAEGDAGSTAGSYSISSGATLAVAPSNGNFEAPTISGAGTVDVAGGDTTVGSTDSFTVPNLHIDGNGTFTLNQDLSIPSLIVAGSGHRNGTGTLTVTGTADFSDLQLDGGTTTVAASVPSFDISHFLGVASGATLNLDHATTYAGSSDSNGINVDGALNIASSFTMSGIDGNSGGTPDQINNSGVVHVLAGGSLVRNTSSGTVTIGPSLHNDGTVSVQTGTLAASTGLTQAGGVTTVASGAELDGPVTVSGGVLEGNGTLGGPVSNTGGTVAPGSSPGTLTITGDYTQGAGGTLAEEITGTTPGTEFDQLLVGGVLSLDGTLAIDSSSFTPASTDTFKIISGATSRSGTFATITGATAGSEVYMPRYDADGVTLTLTTTPPPSNNGKPSISGTPAVGQTLTCDNGSWTGNPTGFSYQWSSDGTPIPGATAQTYVVQSADQGHTLTCTVIASNNGGPSQPATSAGVAIPAAAPPPAAPTNTTAPSISGTATVGQPLSCSNGNWNNSPTGFGYQWNRIGTPIQGAAGSTYEVQIPDEGTTLTCTVTATNQSGSTQATSPGIQVPVPFKRGCPAATGTVSGTTIGLARLGMTQHQARHAYTHSSNRGFQFKDFFCLTPFGIRVGYASPKLLKTLPRHQRRRLAGRVVWISTDNARYAIKGIRAGATLTTARLALPHGDYFRVGKNYWYLAPAGTTTAVLKVRHNIVEEIGIADKHLTRSHKANRNLMTSFE